MFRISKMTDYALVLLAALARGGAGAQAAAGLARRTGVPLPTVAKIMKLLQRAGVVVGSRGVNGGYRLAQPPSALTLVTVIEVVEGPIALTDCVSTSFHHCDLADTCAQAGRWEKVNTAIRGVLKDISLADMMMEKGP